MVSLIEAIAILKSHIFVSGVPYLTILERHNITAPVGLYIAKSVLVNQNYLFTQGKDGDHIDIKTISILSRDIYVQAPQCSIVELFGFQSAADVIDSTSPAFPLLNHIANLGIKGCTTIEISQMKELKNAPALIDKLITTGVVVKRSIIPSYGTDKPCRIKSLGTILHLKKYSPFYHPNSSNHTNINGNNSHDVDEEEDNVTILPDDSARDKVFQYIAEVLEKHQLNYISTVDLSRYFHFKQRQGQYLRNLIAMQQKVGYCVVNAEERKCAPLKKNLEPGLPRIVWCITRANHLSLTSYSAVSVSSSFQTAHDKDVIEQQAISRIRNIPLIEQVDLYTRRRKEISVGDIRKYTATNRKRAQKIMAVMTSSFYYPTIRVQEGRIIQNKLIPKSGNESFDVEGIDQELSHEDTESISPSNAVNFPSSSSKTRTNTVISRKRSLDDECNAAKETIEDLKLKVGKDNAKKQLSLEQEERLSTTINYLRKQYHGVGSVLEVSQLLRTAYREKVKTGTIDKKTIMRMVSKLVSLGLIELRTVDLDESQSENFGGGMKQVDLMILNDFSGDKGSRIEEYLNSYVHIKTVYRKKELPKVMPEDEAPLANSLDLDILLRASETYDETSGPKAKRPRRSRTPKDFDIALNINSVSNPNSISPAAPAATNLFLTLSENEGSSSVFSLEKLDEMAQQIRTEVSTIPQSDDIWHEIVDARPKYKSNELMETDIPWTHSEDLVALGHFVDNFFIRKARLGLPDGLKPLKMKRLAGVKSMYILYPWASVHDSAMILQDLQTLRSYYWKNAAIEIVNHSMASSIRRTKALVGKFSSLPQLLSYVLWENNGDVRYQTYKTIDFILQRQSPVNQDASIFGKVVGTVFKLIGRDEPFELSDLWRTQDVWNEMLRKVLRELFMHCVIKSQRLNGDGNSVENVYDTKQAFVFSKAFLNAACVRPLGGFLTEVLAGDFEIVDELSDMRHFLLFAHSLSSLLKDSVDGDLFSLELNIHGDDGDLSPDVRIDVGNKELATPFRLATLECSNETSAGVDRVAVDLAFNPKGFLNDLTDWGNSRGAVTVSEEDLPWFGIDGTLDVAVFQYYATQVATFLTDYPQSTLKQIHQKLMFLPLQHVEQLLKLLVENGLIKVKTDVVPLKLKNPFDSTQYLKKSACLRNKNTSIIEGNNNIRYYSLNTSHDV